MGTNTHNYYTRVHLQHKGEKSKAVKMADFRDNPLAFRDIILISEQDAEGQTICAD